MTQRTVNIGTQFDARMAAKFVSRASEFKSSIEITLEDRTVNAKSIMGIYSLGFQNHQDIIISADGIDENDAINILSNFLTN